MEIANTRVLNVLAISIETPGAIIQNFPDIFTSEVASFTFFKLDDQRLTNKNCYVKMELYNIQFNH